MMTEKPPRKRTVEVISQWTKVPPQLPYDLWLYIISFLSKAELWDIRTINHVIFDIALDSHYQSVTVNLDFCEQKETMESFRRLVDRKVAPRVRTVLFSRNALDSLDLTDIPAASQGWYVYLKRYCYGWVLNETAIMERVFHRFENVSTMHIEINDSRNLRNLDQGISLIQAAWTSFLTRLRSLTVVAPLDVISAIIPFPATFTSLESLSLTLLTPPMSDDSTLSEPLTSHIPEFINNHRQTLRYLDLSSRVPKYTFPLVTKIDLTELLKTLQHISHLTSVAFRVSPSTDPTIVTRFLELHSKRLHTLDITILPSNSRSSVISPVSPFLRQIQIPFPDLNTLSFDFGHSCWAAPTTDVLQDYIGEYSFSLTSLKLLRAMLSRDHAVALLDPKGCLGPASNLRHMVLGLECLTPEILDLLSTTLPNLYEFEVRFYAFAFRGQGGYPSQDEEKEFCKEIKSHNYAKWKLQHLIVLFLDRNEIELAAPSCNAALIHALPGIQTFNSVTPSQYLRFIRDPDRIPMKGILI